jgi:hypothetical protein
MNNNVRGWIVLITFVVCVGFMIFLGLHLEAKGIEDKKRHVIESNNSKYYTFIKNGHQYLAKDCVVSYEGYKITSFTHDGNCKCKKKITINK